MFSLHESTQRRVSRVVFVACAILPTLATLIFVAYVHRPWREADWQRSLSQRLHVRVAVDEVASPQPGVTRLHDVWLADLRSERPLGLWMKFARSGAARNSRCRRMSCGSKRNNCRPWPRQSPPG